MHIFIKYKRVVKKPPNRKNIAVFLLRYKDFQSVIQMYIKTLLFKILIRTITSNFKPDLLTCQPPICIMVVSKLFPKFMLY